MNSLANTFTGYKLVEYKEFKKFKNILRKFLSPILLEKKNNKNMKNIKYKTYAVFRDILIEYFNLLNCRKVINIL